MNKGMVHIYTGNGKGKTTAAVGLAVRAKGAGLSVCIIQFLKTRLCGELKTLADLGISVIRKETVLGFFHELSDAQKTLLKSEIANEVTLLQEILNEYDVVILDEIFGAVENGFISLGTLSQLIKQKPKQTELVLTGRSAPLCIIELADYVSEIKAVKHPFESGTPARKGIEF